MDDYVSIDGFPSHLIHDYKQGAGFERIIVVIPGNPGVASFYHSFRKHLLDFNLPVFVVGHSAHFVDKGLKDDCFFGLKDQVTHKIATLNYIKEKYGKKQTKFVLVGHSIGCWMNIQIRQKVPELISYSVHCCPTFRHLYDGFSLGVRIATLSPMIYLFSTLIHYIPLSWRSSILWLAGHDTDEVKLVAYDHCDYYVIRNILQMAREEGNEVHAMKDWEIEQLVQHKDSNYFIFSQIDHYTPLSYVDDLKRDCNVDLKIEIADKDVEHAFVLGHSKWMADKIVSHLSNNELE